MPSCPSRPPGRPPCPVKDLPVALRQLTAADVNACDKFGKTWLMEACKHAKDQVGRLLGLGADVNHQSRTTGETALMIALWDGSAPALEQVVRPLLEAGANPSLRYKKQFNFGSSALHMACVRVPEAVPMLLQAGAHVNARDGDGRTPLFLAALNQPWLIRTLLDAGAKPLLDHPHLNPEARQVLAVACADRAQQKLEGSVKPAPVHSPGARIRSRM